VNLVAGALFPFGRFSRQDIKPEGRVALDQLLLDLKSRYLDDEKILIHIEGHSDPLGRPEVNWRISDQRALTVRAYMVEKGIPSNRITAEGLGAKRLLEKGCGVELSPRAIACHQPNRRVVVSVRSLSK
jgi:OOP family OmpA-OmpF porin